MRGYTGVRRIGDDEHEEHDSRDLKCCGEERRCACRVVVWSVYRACGRQLCDEKRLLRPYRDCCGLYEAV